jgi:hypothetical protein
LISETYVDSGDGVHGVVNGDNVFVRVGSQLEPTKKYARQMKLSRGAEIEILERRDDGYYRIVPPEGAKLWMHNDYLKRVPDELLALESETRDAPDIETGTEVEGEQEVTAEAVTPGAAARPAPLTPDEQKARMAAHRKQLDEIDADLQSELEKPVLQRQLQPILDRFRTLADQQEDEFSRLYAETRVAQIEDMIEMIEAVRRVRQLGDEVKLARQDALTARANIRPKSLTIQEGFDAEGELRVSVVYDSQAGPKRYRLVDPSASPIRTIGYVEIPPDSNIDVTQYLGRRVGIRARDVILQTGDVNPISIYVAADIVALDTLPAAQPRPQPQAEPETITIVEHP